MELTKIGVKDDKILLRSENGYTGYFTFIDLVSFDGREFAALADGDDEVYIMELLEETATEKERYREIRDDGLFDEVLSRFAAQNPDDFEV